MFQVSKEIVHIRLHDVFDVMKGVFHHPLKCVPNIIQIERELSVCEHAPWTTKCSFRLILWENVDLIIAGKSIHE